MSENEKTLEEIKKVLTEYLVECDEKSTPYLCEQKQTEEGRKDIEEFVLKSVYYGGLTIGEALKEKERLLNPNILTD